MIGVYVRYEGVAYRLDLFNDENIDITSSQQDVNDISKIFTDYSQNFSIPASPNNNKIFKHWYENALDNGFDDSTKLECWIELNGNIFRNGKLKLEKATIVNGRAKDYSVSFFGNLTSLKDKFKDDKLINVEEINAIINFDYSKDNVIDLVANENDADIAFPLITPSRVWTYGDDNAATDISISAGGIKYIELFPAIRVSKMFEAIAQKYSLAFTGSFLEDRRFTELFLLAKNSDIIKFTSTTKDVLLDTYTGDDVSGYFSFNYDTDSVTANLDVYSIASMQIAVACSSEVTWTAIAYKDGVKHNEYTSKGSEVFTVVTSEIGGSTDSGVYTFQFTTDGAIDSAKLIFYVSYDDDPLIPGYDVTLSGEMTLDIYGASTLPVSSLMPDIKVSDFFAGVLSMFNLTCYSENGFDFIIEPLNEWYNAGATVDITKYCSPDWEVNKTKQYKSITFKYEKSESVINNQFYQVFQRYYGDLEFKPANQDKDGEDYKIELPFEDLMHMKFSGTKLHVGYNINKDLKPYTPKPILLYKWGHIAEDSTYYIEGEEKTSYNAFGQDLEYTTGVFYSLNWGIENSTLLDGAVENSLYNVYYEDYLNDLFFLKSRQINVSGVFNLNTTITLKLNDKVIIRDKRYKINKLDLNLNKQTFKMELITDL